MDQLETATRLAARAQQPLACRLAAAALAVDARDLDAAVVAKVKTCLLDLIACALEARDLPWGRQAVAVAAQDGPGAVIIGTPHRASPAEAAFANAVLGHGLVREDMHAGSISHLGVVVLPVLLSFAQQHRVDGRDFVAAAAAGYQVGASIGRALFATDLSRFYRPTGINGPIGAAAAAARLLTLDAAWATSAIALAANTVSGLNEWPRTGGTEMYFQPGFAARNAVLATALARLGAYASETALDGEGGLFAALRRDDAAASVAFSPSCEEILAVYNKPVPACNFAQSPIQAALRVAHQPGYRPEQVRNVTVRASRAAARYPGCDFAGPFERPLQAKMSIQYGVAATLLTGRAEEANYHLPVDGELRRLIGAIRLVEDAALSAAFPARQGAAIEVELAEGPPLVARMEDVVAAAPEQVRLRFRAAADSLGPGRAAAIETFVEELELQQDAGALGALFAAGR